MRSTQAKSTYVNEPAGGSLTAPLSPPSRSRDAHGRRSTTPEPARDALELALSGGVRSVYQSVVDLSSGAVVAYEALARGPRGTALERPDLLFTAARQAGRLVELDWICRAAALNGALRHGLRPPGALFVNVEPETVGALPPSEHAALFDRAAHEVRVVVELTERALLTDPPALLRALRWMRERGIGIALDDVGVNSRSLAMLAVVRPDVVKLDRGLLTHPDARAAAMAAAAVPVYAAETGATILAEGIETEEHRERALSLGATLGQGWLFSRPAPAEEGLPSSGDGPSPIDSGADVPASSPFALVSDAPTLRVADKRLLLRVSLQIESQVHTLGSPAILLGSFQTAERFTPHTRTRYERMAREAAFVGALGADMEAEPAAGVRGAQLALGDDLRDEWSVVVLGPHFAGALIARDLGDQRPDAQRRFQYLVTYDRALVIDAARSLMNKIARVEEQVHFQ